MEQRIESLERRVSSLETRLAIAETNIKEIYKSLDSIKNNTTWILRLVLGAIITALIGLVLKGGF